MNEFFNISILHHLSCSLSSNRDGSNLYNTIIKEIISDNDNKNINIDWKIITCKINNVEFYSESCNKDLMDRGVNFICVEDGKAIIDKIYYFLNREINKKLKNNLVVLITSIIDDKITEILKNNKEIVLITSKELMMINKINKCLVWDDLVKLSNNNKINNINNKISIESNFNDIFIFHDGENGSIHDTLYRINGELLYENVVNEILTQYNKNCNQKITQDNINIEWNLIMSRETNCNKDYFPSDECLNSLLKKGVNNIYAGNKNGSVDIKMKELILKTKRDFKNSINKPMFVLITSDRDFGAEIRELYIEKFPILVISDDLNVRKSFLENIPNNWILQNWSEIIKKSSTKNNILSNINNENFIRIKNCHEIVINKFERIYYTEFNSDYLQNFVKKISPSFNIEIYKNNFNKDIISLKMYKYENEFFNDETKICNNETEIIKKAIYNLEYALTQIVFSKNYYLKNINKNDLINNSSLKKIMKNNKIYIYIHSKEDLKTRENDCEVLMQIPSLWFQIDLKSNIKEYIKKNYNIQNIKIIKINNPRFHVKIILKNEKDKNILLQNKISKDGINFYENKISYKNNEDLQYFIVHHKENEKNMFKILQEINENISTTNTTIRLEDLINKNDNKLNFIKSIWSFYQKDIKKKFGINSYYDNNKIIILENNDITILKKYFDIKLSEILDFEINIDEIKDDLIISIKEFLQYLKKNSTPISNEISTRFIINYPSSKNKKFSIIINSIKEEKNIFEQWKEEIIDLIENYTIKIINISSINDIDIKNKINYISLRKKYSLALCIIDSTNKLLKITGSKNNIFKCTCYLESIIDKDNIHNYHRIIINENFKNDKFLNLKLEDIKDKINNFYFDKNMNYNRVRCIINPFRNSYQKELYMIIIGEENYINIAIFLINNLIKNMLFNKLKI